MTASAMVDSRKSQFTLALLEGTGWYQVDYTMAEPFSFGQGRGCEFLDSNCMSGSSPAFPEFCYGYHALGCTLTRDGISMCTYNIENESKDPFADGCPMMIVFSDAECTNPDDQLNNQVEYFGYGGKCFTGSISSSRNAYCLKSTVK